MDRKSWMHILVKTRCESNKLFGDKKSEETAIIHTGRGKVYTKSLSG